MEGKKKSGRGAASPGVKKPYYGPGSLAYSLEHGEPVGGSKKAAKKPAKKSPAKSKKK